MTSHVTTISPHWTARAKNVIRQSLIDTNRQDIADKLDACNSRSSRCGHFFCPSCNERYRDTQIELAINHFAAKYDDFELAHDNIKQLTIIHSILPFDDIGGSHKVKLTLSTAELLAKMKKAKLAFNDLQKRFPDVRMIGAFDIETLTLDMLDDRERKKRALQSLKDWPIKFPRLITMTHYDILCRLRSPQMVAIVPRMNRSTVVEGHRRAECRQKSAPNRQPASLPHRVVRS